MQYFEGMKGVKSPAVDLMVRAAYEAAKGLRRDFNEVSFLKVASKGRNDFVTVADQRSCDVIFRILNMGNPGHGIISEEMPAKASETGFSWIIDPLDGTRNFMHGLPFWGIALALVEHSAPFKVISAVLYDPLRDEMFTAERNKGAFLNDKRIKVSPNAMQGSSLVFATGFTKMTSAESAQKSSRVRRLGSNSLHFAYVAAGRFDAAWEHVGNIWDIATGALLVEEAGGKVTNFKGGEYQDAEYVLASNGLVHQVVLNRLEEEVR